jgi:putative restriction endonuclease
MAPEDVDAERSIRLGIWTQVESEGPDDLLPARVRDLGMYGGAQGIWVDKARTAELTPDGIGVAVGVLHTGRSYADDLTSDSLLYHYPRTNRGPSRDAGEVEAMKWAGRLGLPVFAILPSRAGAKCRAVRLAWIEDSDDEGRVFLLSLGTTPPVPAELELEDQPFFLTATPEEKKVLVKQRRGQPKFHLRVVQRYGARCAVCDLDVAELVEAAHLCAVKNAGSNDARNGLPLCALHHRAFDRGFWVVKPETLEVVGRKQGPTLDSLRITRTGLDHLPQVPHDAALRHAWREFTGP